MKQINYHLMGDSDSCHTHQHSALTSFVELEIMCERK